MKVAATNNRKACVDLLDANVDFVIFMIGLFGAFIFTTSQTAMLAVYSKAEWLEATLSGTSRFFFPTATEQEALKCIQEISPGVEVVAG